MIEIDVAIVGGGFSGCAVAANLSRRAGSDCAVTLFEPSELGRGAAYGTRHREHLLNTRVKQMSLYAHDPDDFARWLGPRGGPNDFVSRRTYGAYVADIARRAFERPRFTHVHDRVCAVRRAPHGGFVVESESGLRMQARSVVLAVGNLPPNDDWLPRAVRLHPGYVADPWRFDYSVVGGHVLVIGAGLTALDVLVALQACGHRGSVDIVSRNGRFPTVHADVAPYDVIPALDTQGARLLMHSFRRHVAEAAERGFDWRAVLDALRPEAEAIWRRLPPAEQRRFERHVRRQWERHRHRAPGAEDEVRAAYARSGRLHTYAGRLAGMDRGVASIALRDGTTIELRPDWIVNCVGLGNAATMRRDPLLAAMLADGLVTFDDGGLGLRATPDLAAVVADGQSVPDLWIVGPPVRGSRFEAIAVPELRVMAELVAGNILRSTRPDTVFLEA